MSEPVQRVKRSLPEPTLPDPSESIGGGLPLWVAILAVLAVAAPFIYLIVVGR